MGRYLGPCSLNALFFASHLLFGGFVLLGTLLFFSELRLVSIACFVEVEDIWFLAFFSRDVVL